MLFVEKQGGVESLDTEDYESETEKVEEKMEDGDVEDVFEDTDSELSDDSEHWNEYCESHLQ